MGKEVFFFIPNLIGYVRLLLILAATLLTSQPLTFIILYSLSALLDGVDGIAARKLNQTSVFGAWLDVVVDLIGRGVIWCIVFKEWGYFVIALEWTTFVCTHSRGSEWKSSFADSPWLAKKVMANNFKTPMGFLAIGSLHILPVWLYTFQTDLLSQFIAIPVYLHYCVICLLVTGRLFCMGVEVYCIMDYIISLTNQTTNSPGKKAPESQVKPK